MPKRYTGTLGKLKRSTKTFINLDSFTKASLLSNKEEANSQNSSFEALQEEIEVSDLESDTNEKEEENPKENNIINFAVLLSTTISEKEEIFKQN